MKKTIITCDQCDKDITTTGNCEDWRLILKNEEIPAFDSMVTDMAISPILSDDRYFCSRECHFVWTMKFNLDKEDFDYLMKQIKEKEEKLKAGELSLDEGCGLIEDVITIPAEFANYLPTKMPLEHKLIKKEKK